MIRRCAALAVVVLAAGCQQEELDRLSARSMALDRQFVETNALLENFAERRIEGRLLQAKLDELGARISEADVLTLFRMRTFEGKGAIDVTHKEFYDVLTVSDVGGADRLDGLASPAFAAGGYIASASMANGKVSLTVLLLKRDLAGPVPELSTPPAGLTLKVPPRLARAAFDPFGSESVSALKGHIAAQEKALSDLEAAAPGFDDFRVKFPKKKQQVEQVLKVRDTLKKMASIDPAQDLRAVFGHAGLFTQVQVSGSSGQLHVEGDLAAGQTLEAARAAFEGRYEVLEAAVKPRAILLLRAR